MNKTKTYYQPYGYYDDGTNIEYGDIPEELCSFQAFATIEDCEEWLENNDYDPADFNIHEYHDEDIEGVTILNGDGEIIEINDEDSEHYFSEDLYKVLCGEMPECEFTRIWGEITYDNWNASIQVGNNTILTNQED